MIIFDASRERSPKSGVDGWHWPYTGIIPASTPQLRYLLSNQSMVTTLHISYIIWLAQLEFKLSRIPSRIKMKFYKFWKDNLRETQESMKKFVDLKRCEKTLTVGEYVYHCLKPYRQPSTTTMKNQKLSPRFYGPFHIIANMGNVTYCLNLPPETKIHPVFHISCLKKHPGSDSIP
ncbi:hypothetical protein Patl1_02635 [Pistacia atlantica]|uniref:Uncharacterized protein n=1 Tax=Pistacia atlantica TaxID=434234 RepID=A0ACC1CE23_9ROSI|nr:hypothetical protein Patl1_02635 [Pistacia atlantica]